MVMFLMKQGASLDLKDRWKLSPKDYARNKNDPTLIKIFNFENNVIIEREDIRESEIVDDKKESLEFLNYVSKNDIANVKRMLKLQTNVNMCDYDRRTALHIAASNNFLELAKLLLAQKNINVNALDAFELTPLHDAEMHKFTEMVQLL